MKKYILLLFSFLFLTMDLSAQQKIFASIETALKQAENARELLLDAKKEKNWKDLDKLPNIDHIEIKNMEYFPVEILKLKNLKSMIIYESTFETLPSNFGDLENLKELVIDANLKELPASFDRLQKLTDLYLDNNQFKVFPQELTKLNHLKRLFLNDNQIKEISSNIKYLVNLEGLFLDENEIEKLPKEIGALKSLILLDVSSNPIKDLPMELAKLPKLMNIVIKNTLITKEAQIQFQEHAKPRKIGIMANKGK